MIILSSKDFMKRYKLENDVMDGMQLQKVYKDPIYPRDSTKSSDERL